MQIMDWNDAYANAAHIKDGNAFPDKWRIEAAAFRARQHDAGRLRPNLSYGPHERHVYDLFLPEEPPHGLVVIVHGGYWMAFDKSDWSHLANGPLAHGFAVAMPSYRLCPDVRISDVTRQISIAIEAAASQIAGPIHLTGHSAGGHLVTRMITTTTPLAQSIRTRLRNVVSISGLHDLRPLLKTTMNDTLHLDTVEALSESPALLEPLPDIVLTCWVGAAERPEFIRQSALLANIWTGLGARTDLVEEPGKHHFDVIEGLTAPDHPLTATLITS